MKKYIFHFHNVYRRRYEIHTVVLLFDNQNMLQLNSINTDEIIILQTKSQKPALYPTMSAKWIRVSQISRIPLGFQM